MTEVTQKANTQQPPDSDGVEATFPPDIAYNPEHYPPGRLPGVSREQWKEIVTQHVRSTDEVRVIEGEATRALEKQAWARGRPDEDARFLSATATVHVATVKLAIDAYVGAISRMGGQKGGNAKAAKQQQRLDERNRNIEVYAKSCKAGGWTLGDTIHLLRRNKPELVQTLGDPQLRRILSRVYPKR